MKLLSTISIVLLFASCTDKTKSAQLITIPLSDTLSLPNDSLAFYFPANTDSFLQNWYSSALYSLKEPVLSQNFVGHNIYRFLWLRSFHQPVVFSLHRSANQVWLNTKMLDRQPRFCDDMVSGIPKEELEEFMKEGFFVDKSEPGLLVRIADRKAKITYNKDIALSDKEWNEFEQLLAKANFWELPANIENGDTDGARWVIEAHLKDNYHLVDYHSPHDNEYQKAGLFLIKLSGLKEKIY